MTFPPWQKHSVRGPDKSPLGHNIFPGGGVSAGRLAIENQGSQASTKKPRYENEYLRTRAIADRNEGTGPTARNGCGVKQRCGTPDLMGGQCRHGRAFVRQEAINGRACCRTSGQSCQWPGAGDPAPCATTGWALCVYE